MAQKKNNIKERQIGKNITVKKPFIDPRFKNTVWTVFFIIVLLIFFIMNNTVQVAEKGPYPPTFNPSNHEEPVKKVSAELDLNTHK
ncbi:MAG: hypothetical protein P4L35_10380 [Ignavibacteriaceae bacterium]|nr:hypothetical protein [Ignavibacteriaceae bacterium]